MEDNVRVNHNIIIEDRKKLTLTGIKDVISFEEETIILESSMGRMTIKGSSLHILNFDTETGDLTAQGKLFALVYTGEEKSSGGFMSRLFR